MYDNLIEKYVNKLDVEMIVNFGRKQGVNVSYNDAVLLKDTIKNNWKTLLYGNSDDIKKYLRGKLEKQTYDKAVFLFDKYKKMLWKK